MKVDHITASVTVRGGGIPIVLYSLLMAQGSQGIEASLTGWDDGGESVGVWPDEMLYRLSFQKYWGLPSGKGLRRVLKDRQPDLLHLHGLWTDGSRVTVQSSQRYLVSPHGMLDAWALKNSRWQKQLAGILFERKNLRRAACLHALCQSEADSIRAYGLENPIAIIPNGVDLPNLGEWKPSGKKKLLFLGRIHPKKGLVNTLRAWAKVGNEGDQKDWQFVIAGWSQGGHEVELKNLCEELGLSYCDTEGSAFLSDGGASESVSVIFTGPVFGEHKSRLLMSVNAFVLPSFSEGLPVSVLEAWAHRLPVLMTEHCHLPEGFSADAAIEIGTDSVSMSGGLMNLFSATSLDLKTMGEKGRALVECRFTWPKVAREMKELYEWLLGGGPAPSCLEINRR